MRASRLFSLHSGQADGLPATPNGAGIESTASYRLFPLAGTTDAIRVPNASQDTLSPGLGYRRVDATGSGSASEWLISWQSIAAFTGWTLSDLQLGYWQRACVRGDKIYLGFYDVVGVSGQISSWICRAALDTGTIEAVTRIHPAALSIAAIPSVVDQCLGPGHSAFWDITAQGHLRIAISNSASTGQRRGMTFLELQPDYATPVIDEIYFDNTNGVSWAASAGTQYFTDDTSIFLAKAATGFCLVVPGHGVLNISTQAALMSESSWLSTLFSEFWSGSSALGNHINGDVLSQAQMFNTFGAPALRNTRSRANVSRADTDAYLKQIVYALSGVQL